MADRVTAKVPGGIIKDDRIRDENGKVIGRLTEQKIENGVATIAAEIDDENIIKRIKEGRHRGFSIGSSIPGVD